MVQSEPIFQAVFGDDWSRLPRVMLKHYANRPFSEDVGSVEGHMDVMCKWYLKPFFALLGAAPPFNAENVPVTVNFASNLEDETFQLRRVFHFENQPPFQFRSTMHRVEGNEVLEVLAYGLCWHSKFSWDGRRVILSHKGYSLRLFGTHIALPLTFLIGRSDAEEIPIDDDWFDMSATVTHPLFGKVYEYKGRFRIVKEV